MKWIRHAAVLVTVVALALLGSLSGATARIGDLASSEPIQKVGQALGKVTGDRAGNQKAGKKNAGKKTSAASKTKKPTKPKKKTHGKKAHTKKAKAKRAKAKKAKKARKTEKAKAPAASQPTVTPPTNAATLVTPSVTTDEPGTAEDLQAAAEAAEQLAQSGALPSPSSTPTPGPTPEPAPEDTAGPDQRPALTDIFNKFSLGMITGGKLASGSEFLRIIDPSDDFYVEPKLTGTEKPGTLLKYKPVEVSFIFFKPANIRAWKMMYVTTGQHGEQTISTGIMMIPVDGRQDSSRSLIGYQEANDSVGAYCHPSTQWTGGDPMDGSSWSALGPLMMLFDKGVAVMISDVGNDGDPDPHGVFAGRFGGSAALDGLRAAIKLPEAGLNPNPPIGLFGIAGGGVGAGFAAEMAPEYAPELDIRATVLEGMVVNLRNFLRVTDGSVGSGFGLATLLGLEKWWPEMRINDHLNAIGVAIANIYRTQCQTPAYFTLPFVKMKYLFKDGKSPVDIPAFQKPFDENLLGQGTPRSKVMISSCAKDDSPMSLVPAKDAKDLAESYAKRGTPVTYAPTDCSMTRFLTDLYGWGTDLFGMQTIPWLTSNIGAR